MRFTQPAKGGGRSWIEPVGGGRRRPLLISAVCVVTYLATTALAAPLTDVTSVWVPPQKTYMDAPDDSVIRRNDLGADGPIDPQAHRSPDIRAYTIGSWECSNPSMDPFEGHWDRYGLFFRLDVVYEGLLNPPGPPGCCGDPFDAFRYGPHPLYTIIELDVDADVQTGGEFNAPDLRYLGNVARFGGLPEQSWLIDRAALGLSSFDQLLSTAPYVDRSGEDFHLSLLGFDAQVVSRSDTTDYVFDSGETWVIHGRLLHRAFAYEPFSYACCEGNAGSYNPQVFVQFKHDPAWDYTTISLVYPLLNEGSAQMRDDDYTEAADGDTYNQNSVHEALEDLIFSTVNATVQARQDPNFAIIAGWEAKDPNFYLKPVNWRLNLIAATAYTSAQIDATFVNTDIAPDVHIGDFNGDGRVTAADQDLFQDFIIASDGVCGVDDDGLTNGEVQLISFGPNFSVYDVNYDGTVGSADWQAIPGIDVCPADLDGDGDVDLSDFAHLQRCLGKSNFYSGDCGPADLDQDGTVDETDMLWLRPCLNGAEVSADPMCAR